MPIIFCYIKLTYLNPFETSNAAIDLKSNMIKNIFHQKSLNSAQKPLARMHLEISKKGGETFV